MADKFNSTRGISYLHNLIFAVLCLSLLSRPHIHFDKGASRSAMESDSGGEATEEDMALVATPWGARLGGASWRVYLLFDSRKYSLTFLSCELTNPLLQDAPLGMTSARSASKALRDRHPLMRGVSTSVAAAGGSVTDCSYVTVV